MNDTVNNAGGTGPSHRHLEFGVAGFMALLALIGMYGSNEVGIGWGAEGPRAGFFPFYVSLIVLISCIINIVQVLMSEDTGSTFATWLQLRQVASVVVPTAVYVGLVPYIGMYVSSALLIGFFMRWFGKYGWPMVLGIAILVPVLTFFTFELWFLVPLPKGPLENYLGY